MEALRSRLSQLVWRSIVEHKALNRLGAAIDALIPDQDTVDALLSSISLAPDISAILEADEPPPIEVFKSLPKFIFT